MARANLELYRGFHVFMRSLPRVLERRPAAQVLIVGNDGVSYGRQPKGAVSWRTKMLDRRSGRLDLNRVHFLGHLPYQQYLTVLQISNRATLSCVEASSAPLSDAE